MRTNNTVIRKLLWKLFPKTMYTVWTDAHNTGLSKGVDEGRLAQRDFIEQQIRKHDLKDFDDPSLTLGYAHAIKAIRGELRDVA